MKLEYPGDRGSLIVHLMKVGADSRQLARGDFAELTVDVSDWADDGRAVARLSADDCDKLARRFAEAARELRARGEWKVAKRRAPTSYAAKVAEAMERNEDTRASADSDAQPTEKKS